MNLIIFAATMMKFLARQNALPLAAALMAVISAGCGRDNVTVYHVATNDIAPSVPPPPAAAPAMPASMPATMPGGMVAGDTSGMPKIKYTLPDGWKEKPLTQFRVASFEVSENGKTADVSVIPLGGTAGGDAANINRWRGQVGQSPVEETDLKKLATPVEVASQPADLYDLSGTEAGSGEPARILGAILHGDDTTWYFKMNGADALVEKQKPNFIAFLKSVAFDKSAAPATPDVSQLPAGHPAIPGVTATTETGGTADLPAWTIPTDWKEGEAPQFVLVKFNIQGAGDATAAATVSQLNGDGGGLLANVNRWRSQLGQPPITEDDAAKLPTIDADGVPAAVADFAGTDARAGKPARVVGVVLPRNGRTWFYKLMGDPDLVSAQRDAFIRFVQSAKYPQ